MPAPKADAPKCDVPGCGMAAVSCTDGTEVDAQDDLLRPAVPNINHCERHSNWPHSQDAEHFAMTSDAYKKRS
jgi:hypothetical protein